MTKRQEHIRRRLAAAAPRMAATAAAAACLCAACFLLSLLIRIVRVSDSAGAECTLLTSRGEPDALLAMAGVAPEENDRVLLWEQADGSLLLNVQRVFPVTVTVDGGQVEAEASGGTVAQLLADAGIALGPDDEVSPAPDAPVEEGMGGVTVVRITYDERTEREVVPFEVLYEDDTETTEGAYTHTVLEQEGRDGITEVTYRSKYADGAYVETQAVRTQAIEEMRPELHHTFRSDAVSPLPPPEGVTVEDHVPSSYSVVYPMRSTGYYSARGRGASGLGLYYGTFACNPSVIPYGTKVYIASEDGSFVYGWAIATDTGAFAVTNPMQIDLFYETYEESAAHGVRQVNVYIP